MSDPSTDETTQAQALQELVLARPTPYTLVAQAALEGPARRLMSGRMDLAADVWLEIAPDGVTLHGTGAAFIEGDPDEGFAESAASAEPGPGGSRRLSPGQLLHVGTSVYRMGYSPVLAYLEGLTPPHRGECWPLSGESLTVGRPGRRPNDISLVDPTVSRAQASISYAKGCFTLTCEAKATVNGRLVDGKTLLRNGDLLGFGRQLLRFQSAQDRFGTGQGSIFFCDVWDYSGLFAERPLQDVAQQMNEFYVCAGECVEACEGLVLRYVGDALLAVFSDPGHADRAVEAGIFLQQKLDEKNRSWTGRGLPALKVGVGIGSGEFALGHMGFAGHIEFGALGQDVNLAARIEKLTREQGAKVLLAQSTRRLLKEELSLRSLGPVTLKGIEDPVEVFEVLL